MSNNQKNNFFDRVAAILQEARNKSYTTINFILVEAYWKVGQLIVEEEQKGHAKAVYGKGVIDELSKRLTLQYGKGFDPSNLKKIRQFYLCFPNSATLWHQLSWSHYRLLVAVESEKARSFYAGEAARANWSVRALQRQINSLYYERLLSSKDRHGVIQEAEANTSDLTMTPNDIIKDPYVLEFLNVKGSHALYETELETALLHQLEDFLLELGRGFAFVARQKRIKTETKEFYIDLVFYHYLLKCFVLIDLKTGELTHQDIGQMDMYVRMFNDREKTQQDNPTIGIILCTHKDDAIVKYSVLEENKQLFASTYRLYLPSEEELLEELKREKLLFERRQSTGSE